MACLVEDPNSFSLHLIMCPTPQHQPLVPKGDLESCSGSLMGTGIAGAWG